MNQFCLLVFGGEIQDKTLFRQRLAEAGQVLAADSGARHLLWEDQIPEQIFGDLDSLTAGEIRQFESKGCQFVISPAEKNDTDGGIALREALRRGYKDIRIWGALGGRPDHSYANIMLLQLSLSPALRDIFGPGEEDRPEVVIEDGGLRLFLAKRKQWITGKTGEYLSVFALTPEVSGFEQTGLKYQPEGGRYISSFPLGVSNEFVQDRVWMNWREGVLLCMHISGSACDSPANNDPAKDNK